MSTLECVESRGEACGDALARGIAQRALIARIRREFFAKGGTSATRYGVTVDELVAHLERARLFSTAGPGRILSYVDDQISAVACARGHPQAWHDAWEKHESMLIRACHARLEESDAVVFTRRFWIELYAATILPCDARDETGLNLPSIAEFVAVRPLRIWLTDRLLTRLEFETKRAMLRGPMKRQAAHGVNLFARFQPLRDWRRSEGMQRAARLRLAD